MTDSELVFSILYTSRRPKEIHTCCSRWLKACDSNKRVELVVCTDGDDTASLEEVKRVQNAWPQFQIRQVVQDQPPYNCVKGWNLAARHASADAWIVIADDFVPPQRWDLLLSRVTCRHGVPWWTHPHVIHVNTLFVNEIITMPIVSRAWCDQYGYLFYPEYESMFCDTDLTARAKRDGVILRVLNLKFEHLHYNLNKRAFDDVDKVHASKERWRRGETIYLERKSRGFLILKK